MHVSQAQAPSPIGAEGEYLIIPGHNEGLIAKVPEHACQPDLGRELFIQQTEDCPAAEVHG